MEFLISIILLTLHFSLILKTVNYFTNSKGLPIHQLAYRFLVSSAIASLVFISILIVINEDNFVNLLFLQIFFSLPCFVFLVIQLKYFLITSIRVSFLLKNFNSFFQLEDLVVKSQSLENSIRIKRLIESGEVKENLGLLTLRSRRIIPYILVIKRLKNIWGVDDFLSK
jgi:hypothetical protein